MRKTIYNRYKAGYIISHCLNHDKGGLLMKSNTQALRQTVIGLMAVLEMIFSFTPLGTIPIGPLAITLNIVPIAVSAVIMGPIGGGVMGAFFGFLSFLQCFGVGVPSEFGANIVKESQPLTAILCIVPRMLAGIIAGTVYYLLRKKKRAPAAVCGAAAGFCTAIFNTIFFMTSLVLFFGDTPYISAMISGRNIIVFTFAFAGVNALVEMTLATVITAFSAIGIEKTRLFRN